MTASTITAPVQSTESFDLAVREIVTILDNSKDWYNVSRHAYLAIQGGALSKDLAAKVTSTLSGPSHRGSTTKSISEASMSNRVSAYRFIVENGLPMFADTVNDTFTLISKTTGVRPGKAFLPEILADWKKLSKSGQTHAALTELIKAANDAAKPAKAPKVTTPKADETPAIVVQSTESPKSAEDIMAFVRANTSQKFSNADRRALAEFFKQTAVALSK